MKQLILCTILLVCFWGVAQPPFEPPKSPKFPPSPDWHEKHNGVQDHYDFPPDFPGGRDSMKSYIEKNLVYPLELFDLKNSFGTFKVYTSFVIEKDGSVSSVKIVRDIRGSMDCGKEAVALMKSMPAWKPAYSWFYFNDFTETTEKLKDSIAVRVQMMYPINFRIEKFPILPQGYDSLENYLQNNLIYPKQALKEKTEGKVYVQLIFGETGTISDVLLLKGIENCPECDQEAMRLMESIPKEIMTVNDAQTQTKPFFFNTFIHFKPNN